ncbi:nucleotidyltransferase domain-containing protein [Telmatocola sphagniphila]|uniref:Nucleotidyltransferase domain-containing protein n=1 Tax=Telmatocola sphagniphila TaxID=1123043 RepID=A0A8E6B6J5_9BACT|nr:nucleotidyltransferase domain-containing protein [Telmatocola sphagniphila]QVL32091.1 nucleotidyltransferase domain-containing protein [Telmatocola sphagniphila]
MNELIRTELEAIEEREKVRILYACESGSRMWGFASPDSDFDVRFIYVRPLDWYLAIHVENKRDVIERITSEDLDLVGWDLRKALGLLQKSNPSLLEWLYSPIVYRENLPFIDRMKELALQFFSPMASFHHYRSMGPNHNLKYLQREEVSYKKYLYPIRGILAAQWLEQGRGIVPVRFDELFDALVSEGPLRSAILDLLRVKKTSGEKQSGGRIAVLHEFIDSEIARLEKVVLPNAATRADVSELDQFFRETVKN